MSRRGAIGDDRAAADEGFEAGHAAGRVHNRVGGREQLAHLGGEAENANPRRVCERQGQPPPQALVSRRQADDRRRRQPQARPDRAFEVADAPAAAGDDDERPIERQAQPATRPLRRAGREEGGRDQRPHPTCAARAGHPLDRRQARLVHHQMKVDPRVGPELEPGEIGRRRTGRHPQAAAAPQRAEHAGCRRKGGDDDVRPAAIDESEQRACTEERQPGPPEPAQDTKASKEAVEKAEDPGGEAKLAAVGIEQDVTEKAAEPHERVADQNLDVRSLADKLGREHPRGGHMALPDLGGQDDDPQSRFASARRIAGKQPSPPTTTVVQTAQPAGKKDQATRKSRHP